MSTSSSISITQLTERMRGDWNRRIAQDYRFWMSDGVSDDAQMWDAGERDFALLVKGLPGDRTLSALEIGCGVGRLLRPAARFFRRVIGVDVSQEAITRAKVLLGENDAVDLLLGQGRDLQSVRTGSLDVVFSFATLACLPASIMASYIVEANRVLKPQGSLRLQIYLGAEQLPEVEDTLAVRSFTHDRFAKAAKLAGFSVVSIAEVVSDSIPPNNEIKPYIAELVKCAAPSDSDAVAAQLHLHSEPVAGEEWSGSATEYVTAVQRAQELLDAGDESGALGALELAVVAVREPEEIVISLRNELSRRLPTLTAALQINHRERHFSFELFADNLKVVDARFPEIGKLLRVASLEDGLTAKSGESGQAVVIHHGTPLDQMEKPQRAADAWADRTFSADRIREAESLLVVGFAGGYHLRSLLPKVTIPIHVLEPSIAVLKLSLGLSDVREVLSRIATLSISTKTSVQFLKGYAGRIELIVHPQTQLIARDSIEALRQAFWSARGFRELHPSIAVVSPIYGGSLPIAQYAGSALTALKQRVSGFDMSTLKQPYFDVGRFVRDKNRMSALQGHYVEMLSQVILEGINERPVDIVICLSQAPLIPRVLTELRSRGIITVMWFVEDCGRFTAWKDISRYYDYMFLIQRGEILQRVEEAGAGRAIYLPIGCDPAIHRPVAVSAEEKARWGSDISFVGAGYNNRVQMFATLANRNFKIWGTEWPSMPPFNHLVQEEGRRISPEEYTKIFNASAINLNLHSSMERDGVEPFGDFVNPRTVELAAAGAFQLVDERSLLSEMFEPGSEVITFNERRDLEQKIDYYLARPQERSRLAAAARARALKDHTYQVRLQEMLGHIYADRFEQLQDRARSGPWPKTLERAAEFPELKNRFDRLYERGDDPTLTGLVSDIQQGKGALTETEQRLLFLFHVKQQIALMNDLREGKR